MSGEQRNQDQWLGSKEVEQRRTGKGLQLTGNQPKTSRDGRRRLATWRAGAWSWRGPAGGSWRTGTGAGAGAWSWRSRRRAEARRRWPAGGEVRSLAGAQGAARCRCGATDESETGSREDKVETVTECLDKIFSSRYGASLLPGYGTFIQSGLLADSKQIRKLACKAVLHLLDKAEDGAAAVETVVQHNLYPLLINCLIDGDEEISAISLDTIKRLAQIPKGAEVIFPPDGQGSVQLGKVAAQSSSLPRIRILSLIAKLFTVSSYTAAAIRESNLLSIFEEEIKDRRDMLKTLSALEVLYELVEHPHSNIFLLKTNLLQLIIDVINDSSADSVIRSRAALISGRLLSSADAFTAIDKSCVTNLLVAIDKILKIEESQNTDEIESALETLGLIGTTSQGANFLLTSSNVARHVVESSFDRQGRGRQLAALHAFGSICGVNRQEDQMKLDGKAEENLKRMVYTTAANSPKLTPSALLLSILQQDPDIRIAGYRVISGLVIREWCLREVCLNSEIIRFVTDPTMETTKLGMEARYDCCVAINKALSSSHLGHESSLSGPIGKLNDAVKRGPYLSDRKRVEARPVVDTAERF